MISRSGHDRTKAALVAVDELVRLCGRLPLGLAVAAARATVHPELSPAALVVELRDVHNRLNALDARDAGADVRAVFSWSYQSFTASSARMSGCSAFIQDRTSRFPRPPAGPDSL